MDELNATLRVHELLLQEYKPIKKGKMIAFKYFASYQDITDDSKLMENGKYQ